MLRYPPIAAGLLLCAMWSFIPLRATRAEQVVVVVLDDSGSMERAMRSKQPRMQAAKQALAGVLNRLGPETQVGILTLNSQVDGAHWIVPVGPPSAERWEPPLAQIHAKGGTPLGQFVRQAGNELLRLRQERPFATYRLLVVTDGEATDAKLLEELLPDLLARHSVGCYRGRHGR